MHRFWIFPLVLGVVGALYPLLCVAPVEALLISMQPSVTLKPPGYLWVTGMLEVFKSCLPYGFGAGVLLGLGTAWRERGGSGATPQSGATMAARMVGNVGWLLSYALLFNVSSGLTMWGVAQVGGISLNLALRLAIYFPGYNYGVEIVNLVAIVWAARRTAHTNDVLNPRLMLEKLWAMTP
jgi:hypothetical protein